jgi:hypothetical protein
MNHVVLSLSSETRGFACEESESDHRARSPGPEESDNCQSDCHDRSDHEEFAARGAFVGGAACGPGRPAGLKPLVERIWLAWMSVGADRRGGDGFRVCQGSPPRKMLW